MPNTAQKGVVPPLRFPEFRDARPWEVKRLGEICEINNGSSNAQDHVDTGEYPLFDRSLTVKRSNSYLFDCEAVIIPGEGSEFIPRYYEGKFDLHQRAYALTEFNNVNGKFIFFLLDKLKKKLEDQAVKSTVLSLRKPILENFLIIIPKKPEEQQKIADCLSSLDDLILAEEKALEALKKHKKGLMQQLFPALGETIPKLRFPEFRNAGPWEVKRLGEITIEFTDGDWIETKDQSDLGIRLIQTGNIGVGEFIFNNKKARYISEETFSRLKCKEVSPGDCLISRLPDPLGRACLVPKISARMITSVDCTIVKFNQNIVLPQFFIQYSQTFKYFFDVEAYASGTTRKRISRENLARVDIPLPSILEQQKIADCLSSLDKLIQAKSKRIDALKLHKKGLMQKLFPSLDKVRG